MTAPPLDAREVVETDLEYCCAELANVLAHMSGRRVLLTGGAGFLGFYLAQTIAAWNRRSTPGERLALTVLDNYIRGVPAWLGQLAHDDTVRLIRHDITEPISDELGAFDYIIHAASIASPTFYRQHPIATMDANVTGVRLLLEAGRRQQDRHPAAGFLYFSSSEIYGDAEPDAIPTPETYPGRVSSIGPRACYDESKRYGETLCVNFAQQYGLPVTVVRPFNNYGPGLKITDRRVVPDLARDLLANLNLVLHSDGSPRRTFCYVTDAVIGYYKVLVHGRPGEVYNIGADAPEITVADLAQRIAGLGRELFGYSGRVVSEASVDSRYLTDNPRRRCPDIRKARTELGFAPRVDLEAGLRRTLLWYSDNRDGQEA